MALDKQIVNGSKKMFRTIAVICAIVLIVPLLITVGFIGFGLDFANCFGQSSCTNGAGSYIIILPVLFIAAVGFAIRRILQLQASKQRQSMRETVLTELGDERLLPGEHEMNLIIKALEQHGPLSLADLSSRSGVQQTETVEYVRELLQQGVLRQVRADAGVVIELAQD